MHINYVTNEIEHEQSFKKLVKYAIVIFFFLFRDSSVIKQIDIREF